MKSEAATMALKSRAEVQLLNVLNRKKARSASFYLKEEQQKAFAEEDEEDEEESQQSQARNRIVFQALPASSEEARTIAEVRQLEDDFFIVGAEDNQDLPQSSSEGLSQIELNAVRRRDRHLEAQMQYEEEVKAISEDVEVAIIRAADHVKQIVATIDAGIQEAKVALTSNELLRASDNENILEMWRDVETLCQRRTDEIAQFAAQLEEIEESRIYRVRLELQRLTSVLMATAHALPPEVERIIEAEAYEVNTVVISNRRVYADLVARMETANVDVFLHARLAWEHAQIHWRRLRHDEAIAQFQATLNSPLFTNPEERQHVLEQIRVFEKKVHTDQRLAVLKQLKDAGASLSSDQVKRLLEELSALQQSEDETIQSFFSDLRELHTSKGDSAKTLREILRLELHGFGALTKEGAIEEAKKTLLALLRDDSMDDFFRVAGGLKTELETLAKQLCVAELIYNANLEPVVNSVGILLSALPLESVMERQGKEAERKAVQSTLEKIRKATKGEIMSLLPSLQTQITMLMNLEGMSDSFKRELSDITTQLDTITTCSIRENGSLQAGDTGNMSPLVTIRKSSSAESTTCSDASQSCGNIVDLQTIRKVQRRLGTLVYASELGAPWQQHLQFIADQLLVQSNATRIVDHVISCECDNLLEMRQQESQLLMDEMGKRIEQQSALLHDQVEKLANFFLRVALCVEESAAKVQYVNLSVMDLLDTLKENDEDAVADLETKFQQSCARLRHSPTDKVLCDEFQRSSDLLMDIEGEYRKYDKRVARAADNNVVAIANQRLVYLQRLCDLFGLRQLNQLMNNDPTFNLEDFLSAQHIDELVNSARPETRDTDNGHANTKTAELRHPSAEPEPTRSKEDTFRTTSGLELTVVLSLAGLAHGILVQSEDEDADDEALHGAAPTTVSTSEQKELHEDERSLDKSETEPGKSRLLLQVVLKKVQTEFLVLDVPSDTIENLLGTFRDAILSQYDSDTTTFSTQTEEMRDERHTNSSLLLEERLRVHWPRRGRLDVQFYQPRMGELLTHHQRQERHLRALWIKVNDQQVAFATKAEEVFAYVEQTRMAQLSLQVQLPFQLSLAALQGLEVKAKKRLGVFKAQARDNVATLSAMTASDMNSLLLSCQDYIRVCSSQLFPNLTSCEISSGCDYHPDEIIALKESLAAIETQVRDQISERDKQMNDISNKQNQILDMWEAFKARYQDCMQKLAMKEGLGQKFGLPRRTAQECYRSEITRCESRSVAINLLLASLQSLVEEGQSDGQSDSLLQAQEQLTCRVLRVLMQLRAKIYHRGMYFGLLRSPQQLELKPIEFNPAAEQLEERIQEVISDHEVVDEEDRALAVPFLEFTDQVSAKCQEETKALYQQEGKFDELPPSGVPTALEEYLSSQQEKARLFVIQQERSYREQVDLFTNLLTFVPGVVVTNFVEQAKREMRRKISDLVSAFEPQYESWMNFKNQHTLELRPHLCSPNNVHLLQELEERERTRSTSTQIALYDLRNRFVAGQSQTSLAFEARVIGLCQCLLLLLDTSVLSLEDVKPFSGEELPKLKRKSLKRLRKAARVKELGDPREVKRTAAELQKLTQSGETPRFPLRSWPGIPSFGLQSLWDEVKAAILAKDSAGQSSASIVKADSSFNQDLPLASNDGACITLLSPAHRALIRTRNSAYADYVMFCREEARCFLDKVQERLEDEVKWMLSWEKGIQRMRQQQQQL